jgi:hypothetical protein
MPLPLLIGAIGALAASGGALANRADDERIEKDKRGTRAIEGEAVLQGMGFDGSKLPPAQRSAFLTMLSSENASMQTLGANLAQGQTPAALLAQQQNQQLNELKLAGRQTSNEQSALDLQQDRDLTDVLHQQELVRLETMELSHAQTEHDLGVARENMDLNRKILQNDYERGRANINALQRGDPVDFTKPVPVMNPLTGSPSLANLPGSDAFNVQQEVLDNTMSINEDLNKLYSMIENYGGESWNDEIVGETQTLHTSLIPRLGRMFGSGALQQAELEMYLKMLPDPTGWSGKGGALIGRKDRWQAAINGIEIMASRQAKSALTMNPYLQTNLKGIHPDVMSPETKIFFEANRPDPAMYIGQGR